jgi:outer membrane protein assembly factor BamB
MSRRIGLALLALGLPLAVRAAQPQFWKIEGSRDFLDGTTDGISVDSEGRVRLSPGSTVVHDPEVPYVWRLTRDKKGALYAGTGNDGRVFRIESGKASLFYNASELEVHALAAGPDGRIYVGTSPDGKVYAVDENGSATPFYDPTEKYIWALAFDASGNLLVATGADAKIYRVDKKGNASVVFTSPDTHIISLATDEKGNVYAGSAPGGVIYRLDASSKVFVLYDSPYREVKALDVGKDGSVYAAVIDGKDETPRPAPPLPTPPPSVGGAEVTVTETFALPPSAGFAPPGPSQRPADLPRSGGTKGAVLRLLPSGDVETLWVSSDDMPQSLLWTEDGVLLGTGNKGKVYRVRDDRTWAMVASFPADQATALQRGAGGSVFIATSNPGKIYAFDAKPGARGTFTSKVKDTDTVSGWGRVRWEATTPPGTEVQVQTRCGNTSAPDTTWSDWSRPYAHKDGDPVTSERARFLQVRAVLVGKDGATPVLESISTAYLQRNLRPQVTSVTVHPPGEVFQKPLAVTGELEILGLESGEPPDFRPGGTPARPSAAPITSYTRKLYQKGIQTFSWKAEDPNGDALVYDVYYRSGGDMPFRLLRKGLTDAVLAWDTTTVPNGRYVVKVVARDTPSNPEALALSGEKESASFDIDNTPPVVTATLASTHPERIRAVVKDDFSLIRKAEYSVDGGRWREVHPTDGINDALEETYEITLSDLVGPPPHIVVVKATDLLGNVATARVEVK